jgi:DNA-binding transcriptional LysR family regulator
MILDGVDVFVKVVDAGGFSAAARQLGMPATTVSARIARLEERLGVTLIQRSTRKMHVTDVGRAYYVHCVEALRSLEAGEEQLAAQSGEPSGTLRVTAPSDIAQTLLPPIVEAFLARYPKAALELLVTNRKIDLLAEGVDLAMRASPMNDSSLQSRKFGAAELALFASKRYLDAHGTPQTPADLAAHIVLAHSRFPVNLFLASSSSDRLQFRSNARVKTDDMQTLRALAAQGTGIALLPDFPNASRGMDLVRVLPDYGMQSGSVYFVYPGGKFTPVNVRAFIDLAISVSGAERE